MNKIQKITLGISSSVGSFVLAATPALAQLGNVDIPDRGYATSIGTLLSSILNLVMLVAAILVFMYLILGGIEWITSGGDKGQTEKARNKITAAIVGLIVLAASYALLQLALSLLGFSGGIQEVFNTGIRPINR
jgi:cytochrome bd-type quinol oxidase subunit 2